MTKQTGLDKATQSLRESLFSGAFHPEERVGEHAVAERLGVSRTLARLAMGALEREGLLLRSPRRGFTVRSFSIDEIVGAIEIRGELEAIAARKLAEAGFTEEQDRYFAGLLEESAAILRAGTVTLDNRQRWTELNEELHSGMIREAGVTALREAFVQVVRLPLVAPRVIVFDTGDPEYSRPQLETAQRDHQRILDAIRARQGTRAAELMRDHSLRSGENKKLNLKRMQDSATLRSLPGGPLISLSTPEDESCS